MTFVTLEVGPGWRMQLLQGLLEARGLPAVVQDDSLGGAYFPLAPSTSRLQVPAEVFEAARTVVSEAQRDGSQALERLRFDAHERFSAPRPLKAMLIDVAFWLALLLTAFLVFRSMLLAFQAGS